ncbi:ankyrin repeat domain-containing protein [Lipingzhangella sp. LS1_29]|uniref:Ankyrin repeat domain-containing protein n=1 Tax=Lipingzhangella rawalii TaxID=2055835 RepID=A0ABU2H1F8_9ACTN|nr:ankyrin repeat domain-containing protein [Lipingzhangella rawalii]MDS1269129.1 ankyrin repeat domain-containing protein [Lipingzhangella rawalii]
MSEYSTQPSHDSQNTHEAALIELASRVFDTARRGDLEGLRAFLEAGIPVNMTNDNGDTLLMLAAYHGHPEVVELLCAHGADVDRRNDRDQAPLAGAVFKGEDTVVRILVDHGADAHAGTPTAAQTARMFGHQHLLALWPPHD